MATASPVKVREALLQKLCGEGQMYSLGVSIARVVQVAASEDGGTHELARHVLADVALTQKILAAANNVCRQRGLQPATTAARAISMLGLDFVQTIALGMMLVDALPNTRQASGVKHELECAMRASLLARELARHAAANQVGGDMPSFSFTHGAEEASVVALLKHIGTILVAAQEHERYFEIRTLVAGGHFTMAQASKMILGCSYDTLSEAVLTTWQMPEELARCVAEPLSEGIARNRDERLRQLASFGAEASRAMRRAGGPPGEVDARALVQRYGKTFEMDAAALAGMSANVAVDMEALMHSMDIAPGSGDELDALAHNVSALAGLEAEEGEDVSPCAGATLAERVRHLAQLRAEGSRKIGELMQVGLDALCHSLGFRFAVICLKDVQRDAYRARLAVGEDSARRRESFSIPAGGNAKDVFSVALENDLELVIEDTKRSNALRGAHQDILSSAGSLVVLPLVVGKVRLGFIYADRQHSVPSMSPAEASSVRALKSELLAALVA